MDKYILKKKYYVVPKANKKLEFLLLLTLFNIALEVLLINIISARGKKTQRNKCGGGKQ